MLFASEQGTKIAFSAGQVFSFCPKRGIIRATDRKKRAGQNAVFRLWRSIDLFYEERKEKLFIGGMTRYVFPAHVHNMAELVVVTRGYAVVGIDGV